MENLSLEDQPPRASQQPSQGQLQQQQQQQQQHTQPSPTPAPSVPQLPPQMFTTAAQLLDLTDKKLMVVLRDGRKLIGVLRSWDQFANLVLQDTIERLYARNLYADIHRGIYVVRGENVLLLGEIDLDEEDNIPEPYQKADAGKVFDLTKEETAERKQKDKSRANLLKTRGLEPDHGGETLF